MNIEFIWNKIKQCEGEVFYTVKGIPYKYVVYDDFILINDLKSRKITKNIIEKGMQIEAPTPKKIELSGCRAQSYIYGIIIDERVKGI